MKTPKVRNKFSRMGRIEEEVRILRRRQGVLLFIVVILAIMTLFPETAPYLRIATLALATVFFLLAASSIAVALFRRVKSVRSSGVESSRPAASAPGDPVSGAKEALVIVQTKEFLGRTNVPFTAPSFQFRGREGTPPGGKV